MEERNTKKVKPKNTNKKKTRSMNVWMLILLVAIIVVVIVIVINNKKSKKESANTANGENTSNSYVEEIEDGVKINKSTRLNEAKEIDGLTVANIQLTTESGMTTLLADVTNNSGARTEVKSIEITLLSEDGAELTKVTGIINALEAGETTQLNIAMTSDYVNAYDFNINIK